MMRKKYKTIKGLMRNNDIRQFTLDTFLSGRVYDKKQCTIVNFELGDEARKKACALFASAICSTASVKAKYADLIDRYYGQTYGIFRRLWIEMRGGKLTATYCAGQDYASEIKYVQSLMRK